VFTVAVGLTYTTNLFAMMDPSAHPTLHLSGSHLWSLAQEEQFYLAWPAVLLVLLGTARRKRLIQPILLTLWLCTIIVLVFTHGTRFVEFSPFVRSGGLVLGALLALRHSKTGEAYPAVPKWLLWTGILLFAGALLTPHYGPMDGLDFLLAAVAATIAIAYCLSRPAGSASKTLAFRPFMHLGRISYSLYLFHLPIWVLMGSVLRLNLLMAVGLTLVLSLVSATLSWRFIEQRFRMPAEGTVAGVRPVYRSARRKRGDAIAMMAPSSIDGP
jgi:peptidoglycan/LPS O-acetylase OafA/YrhL